MNQVRYLNWFHKMNHIYIILEYRQPLFLNFN